MQIKKDITMQILEDQGTLSFFDLLNAINQNKINIHGLTVIDNNNYIWQFNVEENSFKEINRNIRLSEVYPDGVLINLTFRQVIIKERTSKAKQTVIAFLENQYKDLDMSIDACQGCMEGLDDAFEELAIYEAAEQWRVIILFVPIAVGQIVLPILSSIVNDDNRKYWKVLK